MRILLTGWETLCERQQNSGYSSDGGWAEYALASASYVGRVPDGIDPFEAAPLTCADVTTYKAVKVSGARSSDLVAICWTRRPQGPAPLAGVPAAAYTERMTGEAVPPAGDPPGPSRQLIDELLRAAVAAPSLHNAQPWRFRIWPSSSVIELAADPARMLPSADPHGRAAHIACGAALFNLRVAAAAAGLRPDIRLLPDPGQPLLLAEIRLTGRHQATSWERELKAAIPRRQTNRKPFSNRVVPPGIRAELGEAASLEGATLHFLDHGEAVRVLGLAADAERDMLADSAYRAELARWVGDQRDRGGIPDSALGPRSLEGSAPVRDFTPEEHPGPAGYAWFEEHPQLAVLSVHFGGARDWLAAGQALQRVWLTATCRGISVCPLTQPLETADAWLVRDPRSEMEQPQMILRIGYGLPIPAGAPRRPVTDVAEWRETGEDRR